MRPVRKITASDEGFRLEQTLPDDPRFLTPKRNYVEPEPVGTIVLMAFRIAEYHKDCDGSALADLQKIDSSGRTTGWCPHSIGLTPDTAIVVTPQELQDMFAVNQEPPKQPTIQELARRVEALEARTGQFGISSMQGLDDE